MTRRGLGVGWADWGQGRTLWAAVSWTPLEGGFACLLGPRYGDGTCLQGHFLYLIGDLHVTEFTGFLLFSCLGFGAQGLPSAGWALVKAEVTGDAQVCIPALEPWVPRGPPVQAPLVQHELRAGSGALGRHGCSTKHPG